MNVEVKKGEMVELLKSLRGFASLQIREKIGFNNSALYIVYKEVSGN